MIKTEATTSTTMQQTSTGGARPSAKSSGPFQDYFANLPLFYLSAVLVAVTISALLFSTSKKHPVAETYVLAAVALPLLLSRQLLRTRAKDDSVSESERFRQGVKMAAASMGALWLGLWAVLAISAAIGGQSVHDYVAMVAGSAITSVVVLGVAVGMTTLSAKNDTSLMIFLILLSVFQIGWFDRYPAASWIQNGVELTLFPLNGLREVRHLMHDSTATVEWWRVVHTVVYPCAWLLIGAWKVRADDRAQSRQLGQQPAIGRAHSGAI